MLRSVHQTEPGVVCSRMDADRPLMCWRMGGAPFGAAVDAVAVVVGGEGGAVGENARDAVLVVESVEVVGGRGAEALADGVRVRRG